MTNSVIEKSLNEIYESILNSDDYRRPVLVGIAELLKKSEYGTEDAKVKIKINPACDTDPFNPEALNKFDTVQFKALETCITLLGDYGDIKLLPYSQGIMEGKKCMTLIFTAKN